MTFKYQANLKIQFKIIMYKAEIMKKTINNNKFQIKIKQKINKIKFQKKKK